MLSVKATSICLLLMAVLHFSNAAPHNGGCPIGTLPVYCLINPCQYASCPALEDAKCVADYCGGCNARWILNGREVTDQCEVIPKCSIPGQVYSTCGSACTPTCEVPNPICTKQCVKGCHCPRGTVLHESRCVSKKKCLQ